MEIKKMYLEKLTADDKDKYGYGFTGLIIELENGDKLSQHSTDVMQPFQLLDDSDKNKAPLN